MGELSPWHLLILAAVFIVLFGSRKLPDAARALGHSMRIFKAEAKALHDDQTSTETPSVQTVAQAPAQPPAVQKVQPQITASDGTVVSGTPLTEAQRNQQPT